MVALPARQSRTNVKPSAVSPRSWLATQTQLTPEQREDYIRQWNASLEETIRTIDEGDKNGTVTYRIELGPKGKNYVKFVGEDNFITREQIRNHAEILPPYVLGCDCKLLPKQPWENPSKSGWKAVVPAHGNQYDVPDWRQLAYISTYSTSPCTRIVFCGRFCHYHPRNARRRTPTGYG